MSGLSITLADIDKEKLNSLPQGSVPGKKRKVALFLAYVGAGYHGMQFNPGSKTIEGELLGAMNRAGAIADSNCKLDKVGWKRAARTDKGVSAVGAVVSAKLVLEPEPMVDRINAELPGQIRVLGMKRTTGGFDARALCDRRRYEYILPAWVFDPDCCRGRNFRAAGARAGLCPGDAAGGGGGEPSGGGDAAGGGGEPSAGCGEPSAGADAAGGEGAPTIAAAAEARPRTDCAGVGDGPPSGSEGGPIGPPEGPRPEGGSAEPSAQQENTDARLGSPDKEGGGACDQLRVPGSCEPGSGTFEFGAEHRKRLNRLLSKFVGTHNFHNYTVQVSPTEGCAKRHILSFEGETAVILGKPYIRMQVVGSSFMLHQIRKMVGMAVAIMRGAAPEECLELSLSPDRDCNTPMAPALGLFLAECIYNSYNQKWAGQEGREAVALEDFRADADAFKHSSVYPHILAEDEAESVNATWLRSLNEANYGFSEWAQKPALGSKKTPAKLSRHPDGDGGCGRDGGRRSRGGRSRGGGKRKSCG